MSKSNTKSVTIIIIRTIIYVLSNNFQQSAMPPLSSCTRLFSFFLTNIPIAPVCPLVQVHSVLPWLSFHSVFSLDSTLLCLFPWPPLCQVSIYISVDHVGSDHVPCFDFDLAVMSCADNCNLVLTNVQGGFTSPRYPSDYPQSCSCKWTLLAPAGFIVQIHFADFELEEALGCIYDKVIVNRGRGR